MNAAIVAKAEPLAVWLALAACGLAAPAAAKSSYTVTASTMDLGVVVPAASGDTQFRILNSAGTVSVVAGGGARASTNDARSLVTVTCASVSPVKSGDCPHTASDTLSMQVAYLGGASNRLEKVAAFTVYKGSTNILSGPTGATTISFTISAPAAGSGNAVNFYVAADVYVWGDNSGKAYGDGTASFSVTEVGSGASALGTAHVRADRKLSISTSGSGLVFGTLTLPKTGAGPGTAEVTAAASPTLNVTGGVAGLPNQTRSAAAFTITGEGGQSVTPHVPATFTLSGPSSLTVTTETDLSASPQLGGAIGSSGSLTFYVGGKLNNLLSSTVAGTYTGSFSVTADYN